MSSDSLNPSAGLRGSQPISGTSGPSSVLVPLRLLAVGPVPPPVNGLSKAFSFIIQGLPAAGWAIRVIDTADREVPRAASSFSLARLRVIFRVLVAALLAVPITDLVYVTIAQSRWGFAKDMVLIHWAVLFGRPVVVHMHGGNFGGFYAGLSRAERFLVRATVDRLAGIIVLTTGLKADFSMTRDWERRTIPIGNTCDVPLGTVRRARSGELRLLFLSSLLVSKGYREAILAVGDIARRRPQFRLRLDVAGGFLPDRDFRDEDAQQDDLREMLGSLPGTVAATYHGVVGGAAKESLLSNADILLLPTGYINEGQPIAVIEALTAGMPVIASDWRGIRETLPSDMHSLLVPPRDPAALTDRMLRFCDEPTLLEAMSRVALTHAQTFRPAEHLALVDAALRAALSEDKNRHRPTEEARHG